MRHDNLQDGAVQRQAGSLQAGVASKQQRQGTARSLPAEQEGQHLASDSAPQGVHGGMPASSNDSACPLPEPGSRAAAVLSSPAASRPVTEAGGQQQAPAKQSLVPTAEVASLIEATCSRSADHGSSTAAVLPRLSHDWASPAQQGQVDRHSARQVERASALHEEGAAALQTRQAQGLPAQQQQEPAALLSGPKEAAHAQEGHDDTALSWGQAQGLPAQQEHEPASLLSGQIEAANSQQGHEPSARPSEVAQEVVTQQRQDPAALLARQALLPATQQGQQHIAPPLGQAEPARQSEEPGALLSRQAEVARQREAQRRLRAAHMQSLQAQWVRQLRAAGQEQLQRRGAG